MRQVKMRIQKKLSNRPPQLTFCKRRRRSLSTKARELAGLSSSGKMYEFSSPISSVKTILDHYAKTIGTRSNDSHSSRISDGVEDQPIISLQNLECLDMRMLNELEHLLCKRLGYVREILNRKILEQIEDMDLKVVKLAQLKDAHLSEARKDDAKT